MDENIILKMQSLEVDVSLAKAGNQKALEAVVPAIQQDIYGIALRFLWHPQDYAKRRNKQWKCFEERRAVGLWFWPCKLSAWFYFSYSFNFYMARVICGR